MLKNFRLISACLLLLAVTVFSAAPITYFEKRYQKDATGKSITYGLCKPRPFDSSRKYPMVVALHGMAPAQENSLDKISTSMECYIWAQDDEQAEHPCFVLCPMTTLPTWDGTPYTGYSGVCPRIADTIAFPARCTKAAIDSLLREFPQIDPQRIYLTGGSMGAVGAYCMAVRWPWLFAAVWPIAGLCDTARACSLRTMPLWAVHGTGDGIVSTVADSLFVKAIVKCGGNPKRTWVAGAGHGPFDHFAREEYHTWLFSQVKTTTSSTEFNPSEFALVPHTNNNLRMRLIFGENCIRESCCSTLGRLVSRSAGSGRTPNTSDVLVILPKRITPHQIKGKL